MIDYNIFIPAILIYIFYSYTILLLIFVILVKFVHFQSYLLYHDISMHNHFIFYTIDL